MKNSILIFLIALPLLLFAQVERVLLDEDFSDWQNIPVLYIDSIGDQSSGNIDFRNLWAANDNDYLFIRIEVGGEINLQSNNHITIYVDTDDNASTGLQYEGIGADLQYNLGNREGTVRLNGSSIPVTHKDVGLVSSPTVTSVEFELAFYKHAEFLAGVSLFQSQQIKIIIKDNGAGGDQLPNEPGGAAYTFSSEIYEPLPQYSIINSASNSFRLLSYNVHVDGFFLPNLKQYFTRILQAANPDIIVFQEIYSYTSLQTAQEVETIIPAGEGEDWYHAKQGNDIIVVSKYPVVQSFPIDGNGAFLLDMSPEFQSQLLILGAHLPCCANEIPRQQEVDKIMAFIRDVKNGIGPITIPANTPIIITGDLNLVGYEQQLHSLLTGDIVYEGTFGNDFSPDWDNSNFEDAKPYTTNLPMVYTWYSASSDFSPGRLDFVIYSGSVLNLENTYSLFTESLPADSLIAYSLQNSDSRLASDHLPQIADFTLNEITSLPNYFENYVHDFHLAQNYPNPFNPSTKVSFTIPKRESKMFVVLRVYDTLGNLVSTLLEEEKAGGRYEINIDGKNLSSGVYFVSLHSELLTQTIKIVLMK